jgi:hypothetical protein
VISGPTTLINEAGAKEAGHHHIMPIVEHDVVTPRLFL